MKVLYCAITLCLLLSLIEAILFILRNDEESSQVFVVYIDFPQTFHCFHNHCSFYILTLLCSIKDKGNSKKIDTDHNLHLSVLLLFTIQQVAKQIMQFSGAKGDQRMSINLVYWGRILPYSNCYTNAFIIICINCRKT